MMADDFFDELDEEPEMPKAEPAPKSAPKKKKPRASSKRKEPKPPPPLPTTLTWKRGVTKESDTAHKTIWASTCGRYQVVKAVQKYFKVSSGRRKGRPQIIYYACAGLPTILNKHQTRAAAEHTCQLAADGKLDQIRRSSDAGSSGKAKSKEKAKRSREAASGVGEES